jgi:hypothetical protein
MDKAKLRKCIRRLDDGGVAAVKETIEALKALGAVRNQHVSDDDTKASALTPEQTVEWYAGQALDVLESKSFFAVNSLINCLDKFVPVEGIG